MGYRNHPIFAVAWLDLGHRANTASRDTGGFISVGIESTNTTLARANFQSGAEEDVKRLGTTSSNQVQASSLSSRQDIGQYILAKDQSSEGASSGLKEKFKPGKAKSTGDLREGLWWPHNQVVISKRTTQLDVSQFVHGEDWARCHV